MLQAALTDPDDLPRQIAAVGFATTLSTMEEVAVHQHRKAQLVLTLSGVVTCEVDHSVWIVPPKCALWIPSGLPHSLKASGDIRICCLFVDPDAAAILPTACCTVTVSPLLQELLLSAASLPAYYDLDGPDGRLVTVLLDQLSAAPIEKLNVPMPTDAKLRKVAAAMMANPADRATIDEWGRRIGVAPRTLTRLLQRETGMSFGRWRQQFHIMVALQRLAERATVQTVALDLGYESTSAFVTMFRKALGKPPARYLEERRIDG